MVDRVAVRQKVRLAGVGLVVAGLALACTDTPPTGTSPAYTLGGSVSGLAGSGLVLRDNGGDDLFVTANGSFTFATPVSGGAAFDVTVLTQPSNPAQTCVVTGGSGTMASANVTSVAIACVTHAHTVGGMVSGLVGSGLVLRDNGGDDLGVTANGSFAFATRVSSGAGFNVTVVSQPTGPSQACAVVNGSGTVATSNITNVVIVCTTSTFTVGGTVMGLIGAGLVLRNNGGDDLGVTANGSFTFTTPVSDGAAYDVRVFTQPASPPQTCVVTNGSGTVTTANITNVAIACTTSTFTVGGTVTGLVGTGLVLRNNGGDDLSVTTDGSFVFTTPLSTGAPYDVTVFTQPTGPAQVCVVTNGSGTVATANLTSVAIACAGMGSIRVTVATTGTSALGAHGVEVYQGGPALRWSSIPPNGTAMVAVGPGTYEVGLLTWTDCRVTSSNFVSVTVAAGAVTDVAFSVACDITGTIQVTVATTGTDVPAGYQISADDWWWGNHYRTSIPANGTASLLVAPGSYSVGLGRLPVNCTLQGNGGNPLWTVAPGATTSITFSVTCEPPATLRVTASTTGPNAPATYTVGVDSTNSGYSWYYKYSTDVSSNGAVSKILPSGGHTVKLVVPLNCFADPNPVSVTLTAGATTDLAFTVVCY